MITIHLCLIFTLLLYLCVRISFLHVCFRLVRVQMKHHRSDREMLFSGLFLSLRIDCKVKSGGNITAHQSTLCQCQYTHELNVKIVSLSPKNVNHTSRHYCGHLCLRGLFPQQVEQFMSEFKMSA